ncbi:cellulose biosynthesis cyclic di-GMP-binding regulatory protein BcsB [Ensifer sp. YR511]|uniref:cellulose biosynthesis cyclic di-GMP-binding regulatory protein BcsB n=1 Tax=Ensifer sp. YR511 TaxID=1855294 RepID=UPI00088A99BF|nr:cellulose biosynthesis cyclic di-GMP-binding regulatory protein BcsB [Ensifer sp. YR511]SDN09603.1 cellulose synthase subunit [Ensifer sp. YR511]
MLRRLVLPALLLASLATGVSAQPSPFDMSGERPADAPILQPPADTGSNAGPAEPIVTLKPPDDFKRFIIPFSALSLTGEVDERTWSVYLTPAQAQSAVSLNFAYQNAIVVAPEASTLSIFVNGELAGEKPIGSAEAATPLSYDLKPGLLRAGSNDIRVKVRQRHRTDCTVESTYELWTEIAPESAFIRFSSGDSATLSSLDDVRAVGLDARGRTQFNLVVPGLQQPSRTAALMRLAQGMALRGQMPAQEFALSETMPELAKPGQMTALVGTAEEVAPFLERLPEGASSGPVAMFVRDGKTKSSVLVISGPDWSAVQEAIEGITQPMDRPSNVPRDVIATGRWQLPETPLVVTNARLRFSELGVETSEFTGRRFRTRFSVAVPSDFYADAYGDATLLLDAAYTDAVLPGSHIDIYINGNIASTIPLNSATGDILRHLPIKVTMRHFKPGPNLIEIEAVLSAEPDKACAPGTPASNDPRFALFDTSELRMPDFARIGRRPNISAISGAAAPYRSDSAAVPLFLDRADEDTLSAAATFLARLAVAGGRPMLVEVITSPLAAGSRNAIFIGAMPQLPKTVLTQVGIDPARQMSWGNAEDTGRPDDTQKAIDEWRTRLSGGAWRNQVTGFQTWVKQEFDISLSSLRILPEAQAAYIPPESAGLVIAQGANPSDDATWTLLTAPTGKRLREGTAAIADVTRWQQLAGRVSAYEPATDKIEVTPVAGFDFVQTQPPSLTNYRLIFANWLSSNIMVYALLLIVLSVLLGLATSSMLTRLGRRQ